MINRALVFQAVYEQLHKLMNNYTLNLKEQDALEREAYDCSHLSH